ncbi:hypothetical protein FI667_g12410, partial [Globisporangium splendens]
MDDAKSVEKKEEKEESQNAATRRNRENAPMKTVIVVAQDAVVANAAVSWKERYERVLAANQRLKNGLSAREATHRKNDSVSVYAAYVCSKQLAEFAGISWTRTARRSPRPAPWSLAQAQRECEQHKMAKELAELQLRFYTAPGDHALMCALGKALKDMRKQQDAQAASFMEPVDSNARQDRGDSANATLPTHDKNTVNAMEKKRLEKVSELTQLLQEDTQAQLRSLTLRHTQEKQQLKREAKKWEQRATAYLEQVRSLHRENGELLQRIGSESRLRCVDSESRTPRDAAAVKPKSEDGHPKRTDSDHKSDPLDAPAMNTLEVVVSEFRVTKDAEWTSTGGTHGEQQSHQSYALLCDYYDFESQISPVISLHGSGVSEGNSIIVPLDFGVTYKAWQDAAFFKTPIARHVRIELHEVVVGCTELVGVADCDLQALFLSPTGHCTMNFKLRRPHPHSNIIALGSLTVTLALTHPVGSGIHLSAIDLAVFHAGFLHDEEEEGRGQQPISSNNKRTIDGVLENAAAESSKRWQKLELICETCNDEWLAIEGLLHQRANALESLRSEAPRNDAAHHGSKSRSDLMPPEMATISWDAFERRLGLASITN